VSDLTKHPIREVCNRDQKSYLLTELGKLNKSRYDWPSRKAPIAIQRARKLQARLERRCSTWTHKDDKRREREHDDWQRRLAQARKLIHFGTPDEALKAVEHLQQLFQAISTREG
jgi:hypothetical protein